MTESMRPEMRVNKRERAVLGSDVKKATKTIQLFKKNTKAFIFLLVVGTQLMGVEQFSVDAVELKDLGVVIKIEVLSFFK